MRVLPLFACLLTATLACAQDNIVLRNGEEIPAKVLEVNPTDLKYRKSANPEGPVYTAPLRDVLLIRYANGTKDSFGTNAGPLLTPPNPVRKTDGGLTPTSASAAGIEGLRYKGGLFRRFYDTNGQRLRTEQVRTVLYGQPDALTSFERGQSLRTWSAVTAIPAVALIGTGAGLMIGGGHGFDGNRSRDTRSSGTSTTDREGRRGLVVGAALAGGGVLLGATSIWLNHRATVQFRRAADRYNNRTATSLRLTPSRQTTGLSAVLTF